MPVKILIPTPLRPYVGKHDAVEAHGTTVNAILGDLAATYPQLKNHIFADDGNLRSFVNVYVNDEDIRHLQRGQTPVSEKDIVSIVPSIAGGESETALEEGVSLSQEEILRYSRHLIMPEVGLEGQKKLKAASVLMIGAGGLGSPLGLYLAAAGVGRIGIVDFDVVDLTNLQRQVLHGTADIGRPKLASARERLLEINPDIGVETYETRLTSENALDILRGYDVIVDGTDNFPTRYLVNDACVLLGKPNVYGSIFRFEGQVSVFDARRGPCYRCLYATPPPPGLVPSCAEGGVLGVLPGIIGSMQALEAIKLIIGQGEPLIGRLLLFDALKTSFRQLTLRKDPNCPVCGEHPTVTGLIDYELFCGIPAQSDDEQGEEQFRITPEEVKARLDRGEEVFLLDVREPHEYQIANLGGYLIPVNELPQRINELDPAREMVVHCKVGGRSARAVEFLRKAGFTKVKNLVGGIDAWSHHIDSNIPRY